MEKKSVAVIGAGIAGLTAARKLAQAGFEVHVFDSNPRSGGKIDTVQLGGKPADHAAEFIDTDHTLLRDMCKELNVPLISSQDEGALTNIYRMPNGSVITETQFNALYKPLSDMVLRDKAIVAADPMGRRAQQINAMSMPQYLQEVAKNIPDNRPMWRRIVFFWEKKPAVDPDIIAMAANAYSSERGRPAKDMCGLQFVHEAGDGTFLHTDAAFRVEGGTRRFVDALEADLKSQGMQFHFNAKATAVQKQNGKFALNFENAQQAPQGFDQIMLATQANHLASIQGLESLGMSAEDVNTLKNVQYNPKVVKFTIATKQPIKHDGFFWSAAGYQTWNREHNEVVFLVGDDLSARHKPKEMVKLLLEDYARAHNTTVDALFDTSQIDYNGPNAQRPCYPAPAPGQTLALQRMAKSFDALAEQGVGVAGTYVIKPQGGAVGYMADAADSAARASDIMIEAAKMKELAQKQEMAPIGFVEQLQNQAQKPGAGRLV